MGSLELAVSGFGLSYLELEFRKRETEEECMEIDSEEGSCEYVSQIQCLLSRIGDWGFDIFNLDKLSNGRALFHVGLQLFQEHNLIEEFQLDIMKLMRCITLIEEGYHSANPYHNAVHAADVAQAMHCYLIENRVANCISPLEKLTAILAALAHDLDHPGVNQAFLIATSNHLAALYNNNSVLENHHWRTAIGVFHESGVFNHFSDTMWKSIEWQMKSLILATDITRQQEFLSKLKLVLDNNELDMTIEDHRHFLLQIGLKCADICNPCRVWEVSRKWSELVCDEFFKQGDYERKLLLPVTPLCDRHGTTVAKIQSGFMQFVVLPLFEEWYRFSPTKLSQVMLDNLKSNKSNWDDIVTQDQAKKAKEEQEITMIPEENEDLNSSSCSSNKDEEKDQEGEQETSQDNTANNADTNNSVENKTNQSEEQQCQQRIAAAIASRRVSTPRVSECEKENSDPQLSQIPPPEDEEVDEQDDDITSLVDSDIIDEDFELPTYFARRHSLPVSTGLKAQEHFKIVQVLDKKPGWPALPSAGRRHSLPTARLLPITSFERLTEKLFSVKEVSPTNASAAFEFDRWGTRIPRVSLNSSTLMNVSLEANKLTDAHGLNQVMLSQQRKYQSEPHVTTQSNSPTANTKSSLVKLKQSPSVDLNHQLSTSDTSNKDCSKTSDTNHVPNSVNTNNRLTNNSTVVSSSQSPHTFHSNHHTASSANPSSQPPRRSSLNSQRNHSVLPSVAAAIVQNAADVLIPRRASLGDKPHHNNATDVEAQPLLHTIANSGDSDEQEEEFITNTSHPQDTTTSCYYNPGADTPTDGDGGVRQPLQQAQVSSSQESRLAPTSVVQQSMTGSSSSSNRT